MHSPLPLPIQLSRFLLFCCSAQRGGGALLKAKPNTSTLPSTHQRAERRVKCSGFFWSRAEVGISGILNADRDNHSFGWKKKWSVGSRKAAVKLDKSGDLRRHSSWLARPLYAPPQAAITRPQHSLYAASYSTALGPDIRKEASHSHIDLGMASTSVFAPSRSACAQQQQVCRVPVPHYLAVRSPTVPSHHTRGFASTPTRRANAPSSLPSTSQAAPPAAASPSAEVHSGATAAESVADPNEFQGGFEFLQPWVPTIHNLADTLHLSGPHAHALSIFVLAFAVRTAVTLPVTLWQRSKTRKLTEKVLPEWEIMKERIPQVVRARCRRAGMSYEQFNVEAQKELKAELAKLLRKHNASPLPAFIGPATVSIPVFLLMTALLRQSALDPSTPFASEVLPWWSPRPSSPRSSRPAPPSLPIAASTRRPSQSSRAPWADPRSPTRTPPCSVPCRLACSPSPTQSSIAGVDAPSPRSVRPPPAAIQMRLQKRPKSCWPQDPNRSGKARGGGAATSAHHHKRPACAGYRFHPHCLPGSRCAGRLLALVGYLYAASELAARCPRPPLRTRQDRPQTPAPPTATEPVDPAFSKPSLHYATLPCFRSSDCESRDC